MVHIDKTLALIGGGPAALFMMKHLLQQQLYYRGIHIFEKHNKLGAGMPYAKCGSRTEHVANVSSKELPELIEDFETYIKKYPPENFAEFYHDGEINPYEVIPRLLLGDYLEQQFKNYIKKAQSWGVKVEIHLETPVEDVVLVKDGGYQIIAHDQKYYCDQFVLCTGHSWPKKNEDKVEGWFDSPYPPEKLAIKADFPVAVRGASLTAVDAVKTLARTNGKFVKNEDSSCQFIVDADVPHFRIDLYSLRGFLPALRFHSEDAAFSPEWTMTHAQIMDYKAQHGGFVDLDYVFERNFKAQIRDKDPVFYEKISNLSIEEFVDEMLQIRNDLDSFTLLKAEYKEAEKSIHRQQSIVWKEALAAFSYAMNYPAKHFSAEDMLRLRGKLMPLISIIIASLPQSSYRELMALHEAGVLRSIAAGPESDVQPNGERGAIYTIEDGNGGHKDEKYEVYVNAVGQQPMEFNDFPFESLKNSGQISTGFVYFKDDAEGQKLLDEGNPMVKISPSGKYYLQVKGLEINDYFQSVDAYLVANPNIYLMAVPFIGGLNPDYSGLDFCDTAAEKIVSKMAEG